MAQVKAHEIAAQVFYLINPQHRTRNRQKSIWKINQQEEVASFTLSFNKHWHQKSLGWGLHMVNGKAQFLGVAAPDHCRPLMLAKFVDGNKNNHWHGYPADHERHAQDRPPVAILDTWLRTRTLTGRQIRNIQAGFPCKP